MSRIITKPYPGAQINHAHWAGNPAGLWLFNRGGGPILGDSGANSNYGNIKGPIWGGSPRGGSLGFDGVNDKILIPSTPSLNLGALTDSYSVGVWFKTTDSNAVLVSKNQANDNGVMPYFLQVINGTCRFAVRDTDGIFRPVLSNKNTYNDGIWHFAVGVRNRIATLLEIYVDIFDYNSTADLTDTSMLHNTDVWVGAVNSTGGGGVPASYINGQIEYIIIDPRVLSAAKISQLFHDPYIMFPRPSPERYFVPTPGFIPYIHSVGMNGGMGNMTGGMGRR